MWVLRPELPQPLGVYSARGVVTFPVGGLP